MLLCALDWNDERISRALHISPPTLRKHYFSELKFRAEHRDRLDAHLAVKLMEAVNAGNVSAMKEFIALLQRHDLARYGQTQKPQPAPKEPKRGKKEQALIDAKTPDTGSQLGLLIAQRANSVN